MKVLITGGAGFIGQKLTDVLLEKGRRIIIFDHHPPKQKVEFMELDIGSGDLAPEIFKGIDAVIHLAGENIFGRWNEEFKRKIYNSRILSARTLVSSISKLDKKPKVFISASAVGFYGGRGEEELYEDSVPGSDFLARVCIDWEKESKEVEKFGVRSVQIRTAPVIGAGGMLSKLLPFYKLGLGGPLASGNQWFPWIHITDIANIYAFALENENIFGPINACSPQQIRNREFSKTLAKVLNRREFFRTPQFVLKLIYGEFAENILNSQKVYPKKLLEAGYKFMFSDIEEALRDVL